MRSALLFSLLVSLTACSAEKTPEELGAATAIAAPVVTTPVLLSPIETQIPEGIDDYQVLRIDWEGMRPTGAVFERFLRGKCFVQGSYRIAEGGILVAVEPLYRSAKVGATVDPQKLTYGQAQALAAGPKSEVSRFQRDSLGALSWVWERRPDDHERIFTFTYPEGETCVSPGAIARHEIPAKMKPTQVLEGPAPGETPSDPAAAPLGPTAPKAPPAPPAPPAAPAPPEAAPAQ